MEHKHLYFNSIYVSLPVWGGGGGGCVFGLMLLGPGVEGGGVDWRRDQT